MGQGFDADDDDDTWSLSSKPKRTWIEVVRVDIKKCNLFEDLVHDRLEWRN